MRIGPSSPSLDELPMPLHHLLPLERYRIPTDQGTVHVHRDRARLYRRLHLLHQARQLSVVGAPALAREDRRRALAC